MRVERYASDRIRVHALPDDLARGDPV